MNAAFQLLNHEQLVSPCGRRLSTVRQTGTGIFREGALLCT